ncbi:hypothetical protein HELRODRAFT_191072 [Helobdella robusta]|uniref:DUF389 domain-containing protein n=1 Tax=Helobdella robusta TaxID=6412 RepID=T1FSK2_HELRO|nr:hypothetical protein HELRODRAFT_191072 [Helobdella robusta]ESO07141.1 hypothetical protein HELRODRAFT_191072 [Helobdella robusta]
MGLLNKNVSITSFVESWATLTPFKTVDVKLPDEVAGKHHFETVAELMFDMANRYNLEKIKENIVTREKDDQTIPPELQDHLAELKSSIILQRSESSQILHQTRKTLDDMAALIKSQSPKFEYTLPQLIEGILTDIGVMNYKWLMTTNSKLWQVTCIVSSEECDLLLKVFENIGFLNLPLVNLHLINVSYTSGTELDKFDDSKNDVDEKIDFINSIKARITVAEVINCVKKNAKITFDFFVLISIASIIATLGLLDNNTVCLVASMLISPMMGPILAFTFGSTIRSKDLILLGVRNELVCLLLCVFYGFTIGTVMAVINLNGAKWGHATSWPTPEMSVRGLGHTLGVGVLIALASGMGVCLSLLGGNISTMVGVAISASLLPPTVNSGLLWGHTFSWLIASPARDANSTVAQPLKCVPLLNNAYQFQYSCKLALDMFALGLLSFGLAFLNICCIYLSGIIMLKIKEVAPKQLLSSANRSFFKNQVPMIRKKMANKTIADEDFTQFAKAFTDQYNNLQTEREKIAFVEKWQEVVKNLESDPVYREAMTHMPLQFTKMFQAGFYKRNSSGNLNSFISKNWNPWFKSP